MTEIKTVIGDILRPNMDENKGVIVCHQVNCMGVMGAGLAKQVKSKFPDVFEKYADKCTQIKAGVGGLGDVQFCVATGDAGYIIANIFGQYYYGRDKRYTNYDALRTAFTQIATEFPNFTIRIPYLMGCGLAGGDWNVVTDIIKETLIDNGVDVEIWKLPSMC